MAVSLGAGRLEEPRRSRFARRTQLPGSAPSRARSSAAGDSVALGVCVGVALICSLLPTVVRDRTAAGLRRTAAAPLAALEQWSELRRAAFLSYDDRMQAKGAVTREAQEAIALRTENARLRELLALGARLQWGFVTGEAVPNQQAGELGSAQTLQEFKVTVGSRAGVAVFTPVIAAAGLVGMVQQVDPLRSQVISYAHPDFRVSAQADSAYGIVQPHLGSGAERGLLELHGVAFRTVLKEGQQVISSGLGGTYPPGIPIGTVIREIQTPERWARTYLLRPAVNLAEVGPVLLLLRPRADRGLDSVWTSVRAADVVSRRIAASGDSIAREEMAREAAARRAAVDSAASDSARSAGAAAPNSAPARRDSAAVRSDADSVARAHARAAARAAAARQAAPGEAALGEAAAGATAAAPHPTVPRATAAGSTAPPPRSSAAQRPAAPRTDSASARAARAAGVTRGDSAPRRPPRPTVPRP